MSSYNKSILSVLLAIFSIQFGAAIAKQVFSILGANGTTALRILFASLILLIFVKPWKKALTSKARRYIFLYGCTLAFMNLLFYKALETLPLGITVALEFSGPLTLALITSRKRIDYVWALLAALGIFFLFPQNENGAPLPIIGVAYALGAGFFWALYILAGQKAGKSAQGAQAIAWGMCIAAAIALPFGIVESGSKLIDFSLLPLVLGVALLSSVIPYSLELHALKVLPTQVFGILLSLEPAVGALLGLFFLGEHLSHLQWLAVVLISLASAGTTLSNRKAA